MALDLAKIDHAIKLLYTAQIGPASKALASMFAKDSLIIDDPFRDPFECLLGARRVTIFRCPVCPRYYLAIGKRPAPCCGKAKLRALPHARVRELTAAYRIAGPDVVRDELDPGWRERAKEWLTSTMGRETTAAALAASGKIARVRWGAV